jgi:hypothetical protein
VRPGAGRAGVRAAAGPGRERGVGGGAPAAGRRAHARRRPRRRAGGAGRRGREHAGAGPGPGGAGPGGVRIEVVEAGQGYPLSAEQRAVLHDVVTSGRAVEAIVGPPRRRVGCGGAGLSRSPSQWSAPAHPRPRWRSSANPCQRFELGWPASRHVLEAAERPSAGHGDREPVGPARVGDGAEKVLHVPVALPRPLVPDGQPPVRVLLIVGAAARGPVRARPRGVLPAPRAVQHRDRARVGSSCRRVLRTLARHGLPTRPGGSRGATGRSVLTADLLHRLDVTERLSVEAIAAQLGYAPHRFRPALDR